MDWERVEAARRQARSILAITFVVIGLAVFLWVAARPFSEPSFGPTPPTFVLTTSGIEGSPPASGIPIDLVGVFGVLIGSAWMWRIYRAPTRLEGAHWRFHDH